LRRGRLTVAISTGGASPAWARKIRERLEAEFGEEYGRLLDAAARVRRRCLEEIPDPGRRREALERLANDALLDMARSLGTEDLERELAARAGFGSEET
jgi:precorrin-2 dehydrogenase/sirohydrochlorin ferrochelatase